MTKLKVTSVLLTLAILLSALSVSVSATEMTSIVAQLENIAENYVEDYLRTIYLYETHDLSDGTIKEYYGVNNLLLAESAPAQLRESTINVVGTTNNVAELCENISTFQATAQYLKYMRSSQNIVRTDFTATVSSVETVVGDNSATVHVYSYVSFKYPGETELAEAADNFVISFAKIGTDWLIADVWAEEVENCGYNDILYNYDVRVASFNTWLIDSRETAELMTESAITSNAEVEIQAVTMGKQIGTYNSTRATAYAGTYSSSASSPIVSDFVNSNYYNFGSVNCMNFVSQCIYAGLGGNDLSTEIATAPYPMDVPDNTSTRDGWYYASTANYNWTWTCADGFKYYAFGINSNSSYGLTSTKAVVPAGSTTFADAVIQSGSVKTTKPTVSDLPGAALSINWIDSESGEERWHAVIIWKATSLAFTGVQICENSPMRKGITLSDSGYANKTIYYIKPFKMVEDTSCGSRSTHTFVDGYLGCTYCDYTKLEVWGPVYNPLPVNTTLTLTGTANATCYRMAIGIAYEDEAAVWSNYYNVSSFSKTYTFTRAGLYTITIAARDVTDVDQLTSADSHVYRIRIY